MSIKYNIPNYPGYTITKKGVIFSLKGSHPGRLIPWLTPDGYHRVKIQTLDGRRAFLVHRLMAITFLTPRSGLEVNHIDGIKSNNALYNLELVTRSENLKHSFRIGHHNTRGENHPSAKLDWKKVAIIRELLECGIQTPQLAQIFGVSPTTVYDIRVGKTWQQEHYNDKEIR